MKFRGIVVAGISFLTVLLTILFGPTRVAAAPKVYVTNELSNNVSVIDVATNTVVKTIPVGLQPRPLAVSPNGAWVYVANFGTNPSTVSVIDTASDTVVATITAGTAHTHRLQLRQLGRLCDQRGIEQHQCNRHGHTNRGGPADSHWAGPKRLRRYA
jgi:YVTN family beta-propeller protein